MKKLLQRLKKDERGLTLVELLAVVVILSIIGGIAFVMIGNVIENSKKDAHIANALNLIAAAKLSEATGGKMVGGSITLSELQTEELLGKIYDPWDKDEYDSGQVAKDTDGVYSATLAVSGTEVCEIDDVSEENLLKGREAVCP